MKKKYITSVEKIIDYMKSLRCMEVVDLTGSVENILKEFGCNMYDINIVHLQNARSAGFYAVGKALGDEIVPIIIDDMHRDFYNLLSPLNEAYYQSLKILVFQLVSDEQEELHKEDIFEIFETDVGEDNEPGDDNIKNETSILFKNVDTSKISVIIRLHNLVGKHIKDEHIQKCQLKELHFLCKQLQAKVLVASDTIAIESIQDNEKKIRSEEIYNMGYGCVSYFVGQCIASPLEPHLMLVDDTDFFSDMNALWIRQAGETNSIINVMCKDDAAKQRIKSWCENLSISFTDHAKEFIGKMQVVCTVL